MIDRTSASRSFFNPKSLVDSSILKTPCTDRVVESRIAMMKTFQVDVNGDVRSFMVNVKKIGVRENSDFDKVVMAKLISGNFSAISSLKLVSDP
jgi:hypothetical protein